MSSAEPLSAAAWEAAASAPDACSGPAAAAGLEWLPARVPGTAAAALREAGLWRPGDERDLDCEDWWFRARFDAEPAAPGEEVRLELDGVATVAEVFLNGEPIAATDSMFAPLGVEVGERLRGEGNELAIRCRALAPLLAGRRRPRARWRTRLVDNRLRFFRTMLLGRAPGFAPGPAPVGPYRPLRLLRRRSFALDAIELRPRLQGDDGVVAVRARGRALAGEAPSEVAAVVSGSGEGEGGLRVVPSPGGGFEASGEVRVPSAARWWPHTHGEPALHDVALRLTGAAGELEQAVGRVGFRTLAAGPEGGWEPLAGGLDLHLNDVRVFARGAVWSPLDPVGLAASKADLRAALEQLRGAGLNMLRVPGTSAYEAPEFHDLCDELGILVWQDFMFANLDYPLENEDFRAGVEAEAARVAATLAGRPSVVVACGNSEVEQQAAMLGLDPALGRGELFGELLPGALRRAGCDAVYLPSAPAGGARPFQTDAGVANYFGVGGYRRPLADVRAAGVRFAAECLAFANVPDEAGIEAIAPGSAPAAAVNHPRWKAGVPRDAGSGWDFDDVRDHYLAELFGLDPGELRRSDPERYLELSREVSGLAMAAVFGEWRRSASPCGGGLVLWSKDLVPGAGWGLLDAAGEAKVALHHLRRALAPRALWMTDEGLNGVAVHLANDGPEPLDGNLRLALYRDGQTPVGGAEQGVSLGPHESRSLDLETLLGGFVDASWAYRFGPPAQDLVVASLEPAGGDPAAPAAQAFYFPAGRPLAAEPPERLGVAARLRAQGEGLELELRSERLLHGVRVHAAGLAASDDAFALEPGRPRRLALRPRGDGAEPAGRVSITALNMRGRVSAAVER